MPIRSDHGRNAALRDLVTWPLHSVRRLFGTVGVLSAASIATTVVIGTTASRPAPAPANVTTPTYRSTQAGASVISRDEALHGDPKGVGRQFAEAWVSKTDPVSWRTHLAPLCTEEFATAVLPTLTPDRVPATSVAGPPTLISSTERTTAVKVALDTMAFVLRLQDVTGSGDWRVADAQPAR